MAEKVKATYRTTPPLPYALASLDAQRAAFTEELIRLREARASILEALHALPANESRRTWEREARVRRRALCDLLAFTPTDGHVYSVPVVDGAATGREDPPCGRLVTELALPHGGTIELSRPIVQQPEPPLIHVLPPGTRIRGQAEDLEVSGASPQSFDEAWTVALPCLVDANDRLGKWLVLRGESIVGTAVSQLMAAVEGCLGDYAFARSPGPSAPLLIGEGLSALVALVYAALDERIAGVILHIGELVDDAWPNLATIPGFHRSFDLESLVQLVAPRPVWLQGTECLIRLESASETREQSILPPFDVGSAGLAHALYDARDLVRVDPLLETLVLPTQSEIRTKAPPRPASPLNTPVTHRVTETDVASYSHPITQKRRYAIPESNVQHEEWRSRLRGEIVKRFGTGIRPPLEPKVKQTASSEGVQIDEVLFTSAPNVQHRGLLMLPDATLRPLPCVLCLPGSSQRPEDIVASWGRMMVDAGYAAFVVDVKPTRLHQSLFRDLTLGRSMVWNMAFDLMAALDYLVQRSDIDSERIGSMGVSIGGTQTWMLAALDERVKVAAPVVGVTTWQSLSTCARRNHGSYLDGHSWYYYHPILPIAEQCDLVGLIAPRALTILSSDDDVFFPVAGIHEVCRKVERLYGSLGVPDRFQAVIVEGAHEFHASLKAAAIAWFDAFL